MLPLLIRRQSGSLASIARRTSASFGQRNIGTSHSRQREASEGGEGSFDLSGRRFGRDGYEDGFMPRSLQGGKTQNQGKGKWKSGGPFKPNDRQNRSFDRYGGQSRQLKGRKGKQATAWGGNQQQQAGNAKGSSHRVPPPQDWTRSPQATQSSSQDGSQTTNASTTQQPRKTTKPKKVAQRKLNIPLPQFITVSDFAKVLDVRMRTLQNVMSRAEYQDTRPDMMLAFPDAELLAMEFNVTAIPLSTSSADFDVFSRPPPQDPSSLPLRAPVVCIMGHVDHGKTTLLDKLRSASVAAGEAGGITQHVGAFSVEVKGLSKITFLDTPGHLAFTQMRSRGARVTDIVVLVVAADDGVMPQTREVLKLVQDIQEEEAGALQLMIAISKVDRPDADPAKVKGQLLGENVQLEEFGGDVPCIEISGKTGQGLDALQDNLVAISELHELRAEREGPLEGYVIESRVEKGFGNTAIVLAKRGTLKVGDICVAGTSWCKVRRLMDSSAKLAVDAAIPGEALMITGWRNLPQAGDMVLGVQDSHEEDAETLVKKCIETRKRIEENRRLVQDVEAINLGRREDAQEREKAEQKAAEIRRLYREAKMRGEKVDRSVLESFHEESTSSDQVDTANSAPAMKELRLIVKADVSGTVEAVVGAISNIGNDEVRVKIVSTGVGEPSEGDVAMAQAVEGQILAFNLKASRSLQANAERLVPPVKVHCDDVIYRLMSYVSEQCAALLPPIRETRVAGEATIQQVFPISGRGNTTRNIAGCRVSNGTISKQQVVRVVRPSKSDSSERQTVFEGRIESLKQIKKEVDEMRKGTECGIAFDDFQDLQQGDIVQSIQYENVARTL